MSSDMTIIDYFISVTKLYATCVCQATITSTRIVNNVETLVFRSTQQTSLLVIRVMVSAYMDVRMVGTGTDVTRDVGHSVSTERVADTMVVVQRAVNMIRMGDASKYGNSSKYF